MRRVNQLTGQEEELVDGEWRPATTISPLSVSPATPNGQIVGNQSGFGMSPEQVVRTRGGGSWPAEALNNQQVPRGRIAGETTGQAIVDALNQPQLGFGQELLPEDQAYIDALTQLQSTLGNSTTVQAPQLPQVPEAMFEVDPGLQQMVTHAEHRQNQVDELISTLRRESESSVNRSTNKWSTLGRWLSDWAATDDPTQAGAAMSRVLRENDDMRAELRQETLQYIQAGWSAEDAVIQAQVALLSGQAQARREMASAQFGRDTQQTQLDFNASVANQESANRGAASRAQAAVSIAEAEREARRRSRESQNSIAELLSGDPRFSNQAFGVMAGNITSDPATQDALTSAMSERQMYSALMSYVAQYAGSDDRQAVQFLRQWDPRLNSQALKTSTPQQLMLRLTQAPQAAAAFSRNREYLLRSQQFGGMMAPAQ